MKKELFVHSSEMTPENLSISEDGRRGRAQRKDGKTNFQH